MRIRKEWKRRSGRGIDAEMVLFIELETDSELEIEIELKTELERYEVQRGTRR